MKNLSVFVFLLNLYFAVRLFDISVTAVCKGVGWPGVVGVVGACACGTGAVWMLRKYGRD